MENRVYIRRFNKSDIKNKVKWINDSDVNKYLHYDLPLSEDKTLIWYELNKDSDKRLDYIIVCKEKSEEVPVGLVGILGKDLINKKAEFYIALGEKTYFGKGVAKKASLRLLEICFKEEELNKIYLYTEVENRSAIALFESLGFKREGTLKADLIYRNRIIDRYYYSITREEYLNEYI